MAFSAIQLGVEPRHPRGILWWPKTRRRRRKGPTTARRSTRPSILALIDDKDPGINEYYGDWLVVNKNKRAQKSRGRNQGISKINDKGKNVPGVNMFAALETNENQGKVVGQAHVGGNSQQGHAAGVGPSKQWSKKKRSRIDNRIW